MAAGAPAAGDSDPQFQFVIPLNSPTFRLDRHGNFRFEYRNLDYEKLGCAISDCKTENLIPNYDNVPIEIWVYLPSKKILDEEHREIADEVREQIIKYYPHADVRFVFRVTQTNIKVRYVHAQIKRLLQKLKTSVGSDPEASRQIETLERTNEREYNRALARLLFVPAKLADSVKVGMASLRSSITAGARMLQTAPALMAMGKPGLIALSLIFLDAATEAFTVKYAQEIQEAFEQVPLRDFNSKAAAKWSAIINTSFWNWAFFTVARPTTMQAITSTVDPNVPAPSVDSILNVGSVGMFGVLMYVGFTRGWMALKDKGQLSASQIALLMQGAGFLDVITSFINSNPNWYHYRFWTWGPQWVVYAGIFMWSLFAKDRMDRLLLADSRIIDWSDIHAEQTTNMSWHIEDHGDFEEALSVIRQLACEDRMTKNDHTEIRE